MNSKIQIRAGWLIDGSGSPCKKDVLIEIRNGLICGIDKANEISHNNFIDLSSCTAIPCLTDCHTHLAWSGTDKTGRRDQFDTGFPEAEKIIKYNLDKYLANGISAVRDGGDRNGHALKFKTELHNDSRIRICSAGLALYKPGRYGSIIGAEVNDSRDIIKRIREARGIDHIKIVNSGLNSLTRFGDQTEPQFEKDELDIIVQTAKSIGLPVMVHANGEIPVRTAIEAGCTSIEHGFFMGRDNLKRMADNGTFWVPTAVTMKAYSENLDPNSTGSETAARNLDHQLEQISLAKDYSVRLALGTDSGSLGVDHGISVSDELALIVKAGYSISEALECATQRAAMLLNIFDSGRIVPGMKADLIAVSGDPDHLLDGLKSIECIYINGIKVKK
jgi:imidazolonepropionase-like amidohydrolase